MVLAGAVSDPGDAALFAARALHEEDQNNLARTCPPRTPPRMGPP
jgi:hypothetical protein